MTKELRQMKIKKSMRELLNSQALVLDGNKLKKSNGDVIFEIDRFTSQSQTGRDLTER